MALVVPPPFEEGSKCAVCGCNFGTFKRRHHCRACGRSLCNEHSSSQKALPQFGLHAPVRVCKECFEHEENSDSAPDVVSEVSESTSAVAQLRIDDTEPDAALPVLNDVKPHPALPDVKPDVAKDSLKFECRCGMPLCICKLPDSPKASPPVQLEAPPPRSKKVSRSHIPKQTSTSTSEKAYPSLFFSSVQTTTQNSSLYDTTGEGLREAIKNKDLNAAKDLLSRGVDPNYIDKQGMSLLHLAAMFNLTEVAFMLVDAGASLHAKNGQGETPLDCAPTTLQYKLKLKLEELES